MIVESAHPYTSGCNHVVQLIPNDNEYCRGDDDDGLAIMFHNFCDLSSGDAEIRLFRDEECTWPITAMNEPLKAGNLPTIDKPLFVANADSFTLQFTSNNWGNNQHPIYSSWGWKMLVCKCRSLAEFKESALSKATTAAVLKGVVGGASLSTACYTGNIDAARYVRERATRMTVILGNAGDLRLGSVLHLFRTSPS